MQSAPYEPLMATKKYIEPVKISKSTFDTMHYKSRRW